MMMMMIFSIYYWFVCMYEWYEENINVVDCGFGVCLLVCCLLLACLLSPQSPVALCRRLSCVLYGAPDPPVRHDGVAWWVTLSWQQWGAVCVWSRRNFLWHTCWSRMTPFPTVIILAWLWRFGGDPSCMYSNPTSQHRTQPCCDITTTTTTTTTTSAAKDNPNLRITKKNRNEIVVLTVVRTRE